MKKINLNAIYCEAVNLLTRMMDTDTECKKFGIHYAINEVANMLASSNYSNDVSLLIYTNVNQYLEHYIKVNEVI